jgi:hypothetical protein
MIKMMSSFVLAFMILPAWGDPDPNQQPNNGQVVQQPKECEFLKEKRKQEMVALSGCEELNLISRLNKGKSYDHVDSARTIDGKISCVAKGGYTLDYDDCKRVLSLYNGVIAAEKAMFIQQQVRINENNIKQSEEIAKATQQGDAQNAALEASRKRNEQNSEMFKEQAWTYSTAVTALTTGLMSWQGKGSKALGKVCGNKTYFESSKKLSHENMGYTPYKSAEDCKTLLTNRVGSLFSNANAKTQFWLASKDFVEKAASAAGKAGLSDQVAKLQEKLPSTNDEEDLILDPCVTNPAQEGCAPAGGPRVPVGDSMQAASLDFGPGGNQTFDLGQNAAGGPSLDTPTTTSDSGNKVNDVASPFESEAKKASGILDPSSEAVVSAGSQPSAPGGGGAGGGGGGGGGGGSSSSDEPDPNANKEPEINVTKVSGKYGSGGGGGFQGIKGSKEDANPFSSLFEKSPAGGVEEDRSIASGDIDGASSGLFQKISKRYGQVQQDKRIESQNLE